VSEVTIRVAGSKLETIVRDSASSFPIGKVLTGSEIVRYALEMSGVERVFAYTGGRVIDLLDKLGLSDKIQVIPGPHEQDLGHAAQGYYKVTGRQGYEVVTAGPGATNAVTAIKDAQSDSDALVVIVGQVQNNALEIEDEPFQGAPIVEAVRPWTKWAYRVKSIDELQSVLKTAHIVSTSGRPGPVVIELPSPIAQYQTTQLKALADVPLIRVQPKIPRVYSISEVKQASIEELVTEMPKSQRRVVIAGSGVYSANAMAQLMQFSDKTDNPYVTTLKLLGAMPSNHRLNLGFGGMHGLPAANLAIYNSGLIVYIGGRFDDRIVGDLKQFAPNAKLYWLEPNHPGIPEEIANRVRKITIDAGEGLERLTQKLGQLNQRGWLEKIREWDQKYPMPNHAARNVIEAVRKYVTESGLKEPYVTTGVGAHQMFTAEFWKFVPEDGKRMLLTSGGLGTMGTGVPFGIGALIAEPDRPVYVFNGDGCFEMDERSMSMAYDMRQELARYKNGLKQIVFRDNLLGMVGHWQTSFWRDRKTVTQLSRPTDFFRYKSLSHEFAYFLVDYSQQFRPEANDEIIRQFVNYEGNATLEVRMNPIPVLPMIPAGKGVPDTILPGGKRFEAVDLRYVSQRVA
jgi:acetolactate synthase I/II/III large subunit